MNIVLAALNAKYTHHSLALRYLQSYCVSEFPDLVTREYNINQNLAVILAELVDLKPCIIGFSCYIWNIEQILELCSNLKKVMPELVILLGGPEVSYENHELMTEHPEIDYIVAGEGEEPFLQLLKVLQKDSKPTPAVLATVPSLIYRADSEIVRNKTITMDLSTIPSPFQSELDSLQDRIVYFETSRGCPYGCQYCLSSRSGKVRYFPLEQCKQELAKLAKLGVEQIRFVDRTFNCDPQRAYELIDFMISLDTKTRFQLEIGGDLIDEQMMQLLEKAPHNRLQFEIGVQSTNPSTLKQISRLTDLERLATNTKQLRALTQVRPVLDLIAGLPAEGYERFGESFDFVYELRPTKIQIGFLKLLKGSRLRQRVEEFGCIYTDKAPYEVLQTNAISYQELSRLKLIEDLVDRFYNSGRFNYSLDYLLAREQITPFKLFEQLAQHWKAHGYHLVSHSLFSLYKFLWQLLGNQDPILRDYLKIDFRLNEPKRTTPAALVTDDLTKTLYNMLRDGRIFSYIPELEQLQSSPRKMGKQLMLESFDFQVYPWVALPERKQQILLFDYANYPQVDVYDVDVCDL